MVEETPEWLNLLEHYKKTKDDHLRDLFSADSERFNKFSLEINNILFDYSKNRINSETLELLIKLAKQCDVIAKAKEMFSGEIINTTEKRAVLHTALRNISNKPVLVDGKDVMPDINKVLAKIKKFTNKVRSGEWKGHTGRSITDVINIGIGGSDLGPVMVCNALAPYKIESLTFHFVSNIDGTHIAEALKKCNPETTLFLVASKTFTTQETMTNANSAKSWLMKSCTKAEKDVIPLHFVALSTSTKKVAAFGIDTDNMFPFWDWVGGRYSIWSSIGTSIALCIGYENWVEMLEGAHIVDNHLLNTPLEKNVPVIMALLGIW